MEVVGGASIGRAHYCAVPFYDVDVDVDKWGVGVVGSYFGLVLFCAYYQFVVAQLCGQYCNLIRYGAVSPTYSGAVG